MNSKQDDALSMLTEDHREVKAMFEEFEELGERAVVGKRRLADKICAALMVHTQLEEELFYPAAREAGKELEELVEEALVEHAGAKDLVQQIAETDVEDELFDAKVKVLSEQIDHHVEEEEDQMFPQLRDSDLDLQALGEQMAARKEELVEEIEAGMPTPPSGSGGAKHGSRHA